MIQGIDVSHYQGHIEWVRVAQAGSKFVYVKASQGTTIQDAKASEYMDGARAAGLYVGLYHYFTPTGDAGAQYKNFLAVAEKCGGLNGMLVPALDVEGDSHNTLGDMTGFPGWTNWKLWQYSDKGSVRGINGYVNLDAFNGDEDDLKRLII